MLYRRDCLGGKDTPCCPLQTDLTALSRWADDPHVLYNGSKSAKLPIGAIPRSAVTNSSRYAFQIYLIFRACPDILVLVLLWPPISVGTTTLIVWAENASGYVHLCRTLAFRHNMHGMAISHFFIAFIRSRIEYCMQVVQCGVVHHLPC